MGSVGVDGPTASCAKVELFKSNERAAQMKFKRIAIDTSKHVFTIHGVDEREQPVFGATSSVINLKAFSANFRERRWFWRLVVGHTTGPACCRA